MSLDLIKILAIGLTTVFNLLLGILVFTRNPKHQINRTFFLFCVLIAFWSLCLLLYEFPIIFSSLFWIKATYLAVSLAVVMLMMFSFVFPSIVFKKARLFSLLSGITYLIGTIWLLYFTDAWVIGVSKTLERGLQTHLGQGYLIWSAMIWFEFGWALINFISNSRRLSGLQKTQLKYLFYGFGLWGLFVSFSDIFIPIFFNETRLFSISSVTSLFFTFAISYTILRHRFLDIRLIVARSVVFSLSFLILGAVYTAGLFLIGTYILKTSSDPANFITSTILALIVAFSFHPLKRFLEKITDRIFYKGKYNAETLLGEVSRILSSTVFLSELEKSILAKLTSEIKISKGLIVLVKDSKIVSIKDTGDGPKISFDETKINMLINKARVSKENLLVFEEIQEETEEKKIMREYGISVVLPLIVENETTGVMLLGEKSSGDIYSVGDINVLKILTPEVSIAVRNSMSYEEIKRFNLTLKEEIDKATKELKDANEKLKQLDKLKDEFVSIASHELRTPMTAIKSYVWLLLNDKKEKLSEKQKRNLDRTYDSTERLITLVNDMLNVSRIESGRIVIDPKLTDMEKLVNDVLLEVMPRAKELGIKLLFDKECDLPYVVADLNRTKQVLINLIGNSLKFTEKGGKIDISLAKSDGNVITSVADTGIGIKKEDAPKLFQKFGIVGNADYTKQNAQGTGLGLYISKSIVELQGGRMWLESKGENMGSTFSFSLKAYDKKIN